MQRILVIHINDFTRQITGGYLGRMNEGKVEKIGPALTRPEIIATLAGQPSIMVEFCKV